ncbi:MAG: DegT/DnrJ/EryC1/StrS aminotransferase family protein [Anaerolineaceae bacterium]|nr:DegT/DnrJ/EryC1/StrS aminotransferase family protein [Anaerolineaceae bacterium]
MTWRIPLADIDVGEEEISAVTGVLKSRWLTMGAVTQEFEEAFKEYSGAKYALAVTNATTALHMACVAVGLKPGDEVILPSLTFVATANAICYTGATPIFAEISSESNLNISPKAIESKITPKTRAIMVMHYGGYACDMPEIMRIADVHGLTVIEDAAHASGSFLDSKMLGTWGRVGCYSFFSNKNMTTGEGGMAVTNDEEVFKKLSLIRSHGMTSLTWDRHRGHAWSYDVVDLGYNYRIDEMRAAVGLVQLHKLDSFNEKRRKITKRYIDLLHESCPEIIIPFEHHPGISACHLFVILLPEGCDRFDFMERMKAAGIQTSIHYPLIHRFSYYQNDPFVACQNLPFTEKIAEREVTLPLYPGLTENDVTYIVQSIAEALHH